MDIPFIVDHRIMSAWDEVSGLKFLIRFSHVTGHTLSQAKIICIFLSYV
jgi:hypothetical protein